MRLKIMLFAGIICAGIQPSIAQWTNNGGNLTTNDNVGINLSNPSEAFHIKGIGYFHHSTGGMKIDGVMNTSANGYVRGSILSSRDGDLEWNTNTNRWTLGSGSHNDFAAIMHTSNGELGFFTGTHNAFTELSNTNFRNQFERMTIKGNGNVGIGKKNPSAKLSVNGDIRSKEVTVENTGWPDYIFGEDYSLPNLADLASFIHSKNHLPGIPTEEEIEREGQDLGVIQAKLLEKIEELTLYMIEHRKLIDQQQQLLEKQQKKIERLKMRLDKR